MSQPATHRFGSRRALAVSVSLGNGQSDISSDIEIQPVAPTIAGFAPPIVPPSQATTVTIRGTGFFAGSLPVLLSHPNGLSAGSSLVVAGPEAKIVFVTSNALQRGFFGVAPADANCQSLADAAGLSGSFKACLSESQASPTTQSPSTTFDTTGGPYVTSGGALIANDWADWTDGALLAPIDSDESGHPTQYGSSLLLRLDGDIRRRHGAPERERYLQRMESVHRRRGSGLLQLDQLTMELQRDGQLQ